MSAARCLRVPLAALALAAATRAEPCTVRLAAGADVARALAAARAERAVTLCLAPGEFPLAGPLVIERDRVTVRGAGARTVLRLEPGVQSPVVIVGDHRRQVPARPTADVALEDLRIVGGGGAGAEHHAEYPYLTNSAVVVRAGRRIHLRGLDVGACRSACILTEHDTRDVIVADSTVSGSTWDGISLNRTARARLVGNTVRDNTAAGITAEHLEDGVIADNTIADNRSHGIYLADSYRNRIVGNRFGRNTNAGVFLTCSVRLRDPGPVLCWDDSMSQGNVFERNRFLDNRRGYIVAGDAAANCKRRGVQPNVSRGDVFRRTPHVEQDVARAGRCLHEARPPAADGAGVRRAVTRQQRG
jgi:parallel beta-helix repeat protein